MRGSGALALENDVKRDQVVSEASNAEGNIGS